MLDKLSLSLKSFIKSRLIDTSIKIVLRRPTEDYSPEDDTIGLFLYDIYENIELRSNQPRIEFDYQGGTAIIKRPPLRLNCSYLMTAWPGRNGNFINEEEKFQREHELLGALTELAADCPSIPFEYLKDNGLTLDQLPLPALSLNRDQNMKASELWGAIKSAIKPSFTLTVTICIPSRETDNQPLFTKMGGGFQSAGQADLTGSLQLACMVRHEEEGIPYAVLEIKELGLKEITDLRGIGIFNSVVEGEYSLDAYAAGYNPVLDKKITVSAHTKGEFIINLAKQ